MPTVVLLISIMLVMQYRFLRTLEQATASAERNAIRGAVEQVRGDVDTYYRTAATAALSLDPATMKNPAWHFRANPVAGARTFFIAAYHKHVSSMHLYTPSGWKKSKPPVDEMEGIKMASAPWYFMHKLDRPIAKSELHVDERDPRHRVIMRPIVDDAKRVVGVAGVVLDEAATKEAMLRIGKQTLSGRRAANQMALRISDKFPIMPNNRNFITQPLGFVYTKWSVGVTDACASPEEIAGHNFRLNLLWSGLVTLMLCGSVALAVSAAARQMRLSQMKSDFVSNVSHELRTPLSSIRVFGEYMRLGRVTKPEKIREYGEYIEAEGRRLTQLINNILDFSKIESSEKKYRFCEIDVVELVSQTVAAFEVPMRDQGIAVTLHAPPTPLVLSLDKDAIGQVLMNLLDNAVKYSNGNKQVEVRVSEGNGEVRIGVRDHGIGIPAREQKKIFEKFYRVGSGLVHDVKGSGLGLAIVNHVVQAHGGRVEVASTPGEGSVFTIVLPRGGVHPVPVPNTPEFA